MKKQLTKQGYWAILYKEMCSFNSGFSVIVSGAYLQFLTPLKSGINEPRFGYFKLSAIAAFATPEAARPVPPSLSNLADRTIPTAFDRSDMGHRFNIKLTDKNSGIKKEITGEIPDADWGKMLRYAGYFEDLLETTFVKQGMKSSFSIKFRENGTIEDQSILPDDDVIAAFLHRIRPLVLQNEPTNFHTVCNVLARYIDDEHFRAVIQKQKDLYIGKDMQKQIMIDVDGSILNSEQSLNKWLNAFEYHRDEAKRAEFEEFGKVSPLQSIKALFVSLITDQAQAMHTIYHIIRGLEKRDGRQFRLRYDRDN